ncbi:LicD family protein [Paeniclostridium hominis]|uniref:LicD family protein n=1 Tax=Paeniclostridium hominis TaxID=2764329 RepID=UPI0022DFA92A|nr:LicD family protein [Paeniclostridium hominis]
MLKEKIDKIIEDKSIDVLRKYQLVECEMLFLIDSICRKYNLKYWIDAGTLLGAIRHGGFIPWDDDCDICMPREDYKKLNELLKKGILPEYMKFGNRQTKEWIQKHKTEKHGFTQIYYTGKFKGFDIQVNQIHIGAFIDIFPVDSVDENICDESKYKLINKIIHMERRNKRCMKDYVKHILQKMPIENIWIKKCNKLEKRGESDYLVYGIETVFMEFKYAQKKSDVYPLVEVEFEGYKFYAPRNYDNYLKKLYGDYMKLPDKDKRYGHLINLEL